MSFIPITVFSDYTLYPNDPLFKEIVIEFNNLSCETRCKIFKSILPKSNMKCKGRETSNKGSGASINTNNNNTNNEENETAKQFTPETAATNPFEIIKKELKSNHSEQHIKIFIKYFKISIENQGKLENEETWYPSCFGEWVY